MSGVFRVVVAGHSHFSMGCCPIRSGGGLKSPGPGCGLVIYCRSSQSRGEFTVRPSPGGSHAASLKVENASLVKAAAALNAVAAGLESNALLAVNHCGGPATIVSSAVQKCMSAWQVGLGVYVADAQGTAAKVRTATATYEQSDSSLAAGLRRTGSLMPRIKQ